MSFSNGDDSEGINDINITPFVDVVLVLLVIFMVTAPMMIKTSMELELPSAKNTDEIEQTALGITILKSGNVMLNGELISPTDLEQKIRSSIKLNPKNQVIIIADKMATHGMVIELLDRIKGVGATNFAFQVEKKKNE